MLKFNRHMHHLSSRVRQRFQDLSWLPMPVSPSSVSLAFPLRTCRSLDELWIFQVWPATYKYQTGRKSETQELPPRCRHAEPCSFFSNPFSKFASWPPLFFPPYCCTSSCTYWTLWKLQSVEFYSSDFHQVAQFITRSVHTDGAGESPWCAIYSKILILSMS